jgi:hypothetical protein
VNTSLSRLWIALFSTVTFPSVLASNIGFLKDAAIGKFNDEDMRLLNETVDLVLADEKAPAKREWKNAATGHSGTLQATTAFSGPNGESCKRLRVINHAGSIESKSTYTMCNMPPDGWRWVPSDFAPQPKAKS